MKYLLPLLILCACSSRPDKNTSLSSGVTNQSFKKVKPLSSSDISDYYSGSVPSLNPALADETVDRFSIDEMKAINTSVDPLVDMAVRCAKKDFDGAFNVASKHFLQYQKVAPYWNQIANCHLNQGSYRKALLFYNKALEVSPNFVPALNNIGVMYSRQGMDQKALVAFERANKQSKFSKTPRYNLARIYLTYGLADSALPIFQSLLNESPGDVDLLNATGSSYFIMSDYGRAFSYYQKIPQSEWRRAEIGLNVAVTLKKLGKRKEALDVFNTVQQPQTANLKRYYASIKNQLGDAE